MHETSKAVQRRLHDANFITKYFRGCGVDIGAGDDPLGAYNELFPLMRSCLSWDRADGDAESMVGVPDETYDFVHSSHCLEDMHSPDTALKNWLRVLKPGGYLIVTVPDEDMYEQGIFPSTFNADHKHTFTIYKTSSWNGEKSVNLYDILCGLGDVADLIKIEQLTSTYRYGLDRQDQTRTPIGEAAIEFVVRKRATKAEYLPKWPQTTRTVHIEMGKPKIALHRPGAIGDIVMTLSLVPLLKAKYPDHEIHYFCHPSIGVGLARLMKAAGVDRGIDCALLEQKSHNYEKIFNLVGYPISEGYPDKPMAYHLIKYFADEMGVKWHSLGLPYLTLNINKPVTPLLEHYATIHPQAGWSAYKNWDLKNWENVIAQRPDIKFYQIGSAADHKLVGADHGFMGQPLDASIDLMMYAHFHLGVDSWTNHLTNIEWKGRGFTPAIILWGSTQASAAGYPRNTNISLDLSCQPCFREDPKISKMPRGPCINPPGQDYDHPKHACMSGITVDRVLTEIEKLWPTGSPLPQSSTD